MNKIEKKIVGYKVVKELVEQPTELTRGLNETIQRKVTLSGKTYKIKPNTGNDSYYITINNQEVDGIQYPIEIFIRIGKMCCSKNKLK